MAKQVQLRRGTAAQNAAFTGATGEVSVDTTSNSLRVHDNSTSGGHPVSFVSGTVMLFVQTAAPIGWTKLATNDNSAIRIVTGSASSGGTDDFDTVFGGAITTVAHVLTEAELAAHVHQIEPDPVYNDNNGGNSGASQSFGTIVDGDIQVNAKDTQSTGGGGGHTHSMTMDLKFVDVIQASKD